MKPMSRTLAIGALVVALATPLAPGDANAVLVDLGPGSFTPLAAVIEFDEVPLGTVNPVYNFMGLTGLGDVTVSFAGFFLGQAATGGFPVTLSDSSPTGPLALDPASTATVTVNDAAPGATSPVLSGTPTFNGPISVLFSVPVAGVGLKGGFFDTIGATTIEAYDAAGNTLGSIVNTVTGFEFFGLADSTGANVIKGISFFITGNEPAGFQIDNLTFGAAAAIVQAPEPSALLLLALGIAAFAAFRNVRRTGLA